MMTGIKSATGLWKACTAVIIGHLPFCTCSPRSSATPPCPCSSSETKTCILIGNSCSDFAQIYCYTVTCQFSCMWDAADVLISWTNGSQIRQLVPGTQPILHYTTLLYFYIITFQKKNLTSDGNHNPNKRRKIEKRKKMMNKKRQMHWCISTEV